MCETLKKKFWKLVPDVNIVVGREITSVHRNYRRRGIASTLSHLHLDKDTLKVNKFNIETITNCFK